MLSSEESYFFRVKSSKVQLRHFPYNTFTIDFIFMSTVLK